MANEATTIFGKCLPPLRTSIEQCGLLSTCDLSIPKPEDLDTIFKDGSQYRLMRPLFQFDIEAKACKAKQSNLYQFFATRRYNMSSSLGTQKIGSGLLKINPYILAQRKQPINNNFWQVTNGLQCDINGVADGGGSYWRVDMSSDDGTIPASAAWFSERKMVFIKGLSAGGSITNTAWQVVSSAVVGTKTQVVLASQNGGSFFPLANLESPVTGVAVRGVPNVSSFESFCLQDPGLINNNGDPFFVQETRWTTCEDERTEKFLELLRGNNELFSTYYDLPLMQLNKQIMGNFQQDWVNSIMKQKPISALQTMATADQLETVYGLTLDGEKCVGKRANATGIEEQLVEQNRYVDLQGGTLNFPALFEALYRMHRLRQTNGHPNPDIFEAFIPTQFFPAFRAGMIAYVNAQSGNAVLQQNIEKIFETAKTGFRYVDFPLIQPGGCTLRIMFDNYFDDNFIVNQRAGQANAGREMWIIDWPNIKTPIFSSKRVVNKTGDLGTLSAVNMDYACRMEVERSTKILTGFGFTTIVECPQSSLIIANFSGAVPEHANLVGEYGGDCAPTTTTTTTAGIS